MSYPYFFISPDDIDGQTIVLSGEEFDHLVKVLRAGPESKVSLSDNFSFRYEAKILDIKKEHATLSITGKRRIEKKIPDITLFQCILKKAAMEVLIQKACEIGADAVIPVISNRIVPDPKKAEAKISRWQKIARQACMQSKRDFITPVSGPVVIEDVYPSGYSRFYMPYEGSSTGLFLDFNKKPESIALITGPEGGFEKREADMLRDKGACMVSLGNNILRAETASIYMLSVINYFFKDENG